MRFTRPYSLHQRSSPWSQTVAARHAINSDTLHALSADVQDVQMSKLSRRPPRCRLRLGSGGRRPANSGGDQRLIERAVIDPEMARRERDVELAVLLQ